MPDGSQGRVAVYAYGHTSHVGGQEQGMSEDRTDSDPLMRRLAGAGRVSVDAGADESALALTRVFEDPQVRAAFDRGGRRRRWSPRAQGRGHIRLGVLGGRAGDRGARGRVGDVRGSDRAVR